MFTKLAGHLYLGDADDARNAKHHDDRLTRPYLFVDARPFFNILQADPNPGELMIEPLRALSAACATLICNGVDVYVYCQAGMERSPFLAALIMFQIGDWTLNEGYELVKAKHPQTLLYPQWVKAMEEFP